VSDLARALAVLHESQIERCEHQDNPDVRQQSRPRVIPEEEDVDAYDNRDQGCNVEPDHCVFTLSVIGSDFHQTNTCARYEGDVRLSKIAEMASVLGKRVRVRWKTIRRS
jgi:hypothetical protein